MSNRIPSTSPDYEATGAIGNFDLQCAVISPTVTGAIPIKEGSVYLNGAGALAMTLALPVAGLPSAGGDDGRTLIIKSVTAQAHTVTTPANGINTNKHILTFSAALTDCVELQAFNGSWQTVGTPSGITIS